MGFSYRSLSDGELFNIMVPFFKSNLNFECLELYVGRLKHEYRHSFVSALAKFGSLKELILMHDKVMPSTDWSFRFEET